MNTNLTCKVTLYLRLMIAQSLAFKEWTHNLLPLTNSLLSSSTMRLLVKKKFNWALKTNKTNNSMTKFIQGSNFKPTSRANLCYKTMMPQESLQQVWLSLHLLINNLFQFPLKLMSTTMEMMTVWYRRAQKRCKRWLRSKNLSEKWQTRQTLLTRKRKSSLLKDSFKVMELSLHGKRKTWEHLLPLAQENII